MPRLDGFPHPGRCHIPGLVKLDAKRNIPHRIKADARFPEAVLGLLRTIFERRDVKEDRSGGT